MAFPRSTLDTAIDEAVSFLENLTNEAKNRNYWKVFKVDLFPNLHLPSFTRMSSAIECFDEILFNNAFVNSSVEIKYIREERDSASTNLGSTTLNADGSITVRICVESHRNGDAWEVMQTLLHELCHVYIIIITGSMHECHGVPWQKLSIAVERVMTRFLGRKVDLARRFGARGDVKEGRCPHFSAEGVEYFFPKSSYRNKERVRCQC